MKKVSIMAACVTTFFYLCCGGFGYAAFGNSTPGNLLTGFGFYEPYWLVDFANACVVLHLVGGYQVLLPKCLSSLTLGPELAFVLELGRFVYKANPFFLLLYFTILSL